MSAPIPSFVHAEKPGVIKRFPFGALSLAFGVGQAVAWAVIFSLHNIGDVLLNSSELNTMESLLLWVPAVLAVILGVVGIVLGRKPRQPQASPVLAADDTWYVPVEPRTGMANGQKLAVAGLSVGASLLAMAAAAIVAVGVVIVAGLLLLLWVFSKISG